MSKYYLGLFFYFLFAANSVFAESSEEEVSVNLEPAVEVDICEKFSLDKGDEIKLLIDDFSDEKLIKIIFYSKLLEKNHSLYLCEIDKIIDSCFKLNNRRFNLNNAIRLLKAAAFFGCSVGCGYIGINAWRNGPSNQMTRNQHNIGLIASGAVGFLFGVHGLTELQKISNNYDQTQLYYKAIAMKNALLNYRKK